MLQPCAALPRAVNCAESRSPVFRIAASEWRIVGRGAHLTSLGIWRHENPPRLFFPLKQELELGRGVLFFKGSGSYHVVNVSLDQAVEALVQEFR